MFQRHESAAPRTYDVIVVLGAAVWPGEQPSPALRRRVLHAVDLLQHGYATRLLVTGGVGKHPPAEAKVMQRVAVAHGIPHASIVLEDQATSTFESAWRCRDLLGQHSWSHVLIVTDRYHLTRALLAFRSVGIRAGGSAVPGKPARRLWQRWHYYLRERLALAWYLARAVPVALRRWRQPPGYGTGAGARR
jgi:uncharacterized SAM-binding protein YcdF (DUF218 family)